MPTPNKPSPKFVPASRNNSSLPSLLPELLRILFLNVWFSPETREDQTSSYLIFALQSEEWLESHTTFVILALGILTVQLPFLSWALVRGRCSAEVTLWTPAWAGSFGSAHFSIPQCYKANVVSLTGTTMGKKITVGKRGGERKKLYGTFLEFLSATRRYLLLPSSAPVRKAESYCLLCHLSVPSSLFQCRNVLPHLLSLISLWFFSVYFLMLS